MIFGLEDVIVLSRTAARKSLELASLSYKPDTSAAKAALLSDLLVKDLNRIHLMADIAADNLSDIADRLDSLSDADDAIPPEIQSEYLAGLGPREIADETAYWTLVPRFLSMVPYLREGLALSEKVLAGESPLGDVKAMEVIRAREVLLELYARGDSIGEEPLECVKILVVLCSQLLRIHSGRDLETNEISELIRALGMFDREEISDRLSGVACPSEWGMLAAFLSDWDRHLSVLCSRALSNAVVRDAIDGNDS